MPLIIPRFTLPTCVAKVARHLPQWPHAVVLCLALNLARHLGALPVDDLAALEGKRFCVEVEDAGSLAHFSFRHGRFTPDLGTPPPDLRFRARLSAYLQLLNRQEDPDTLFFQRALVIEGDTELGLRVKNMLDAVDWSGVFGRLPGPVQRVSDVDSTGFRA